MGAPDVTIPMSLLLVKEVSFKGSFRYGVSFFIFRCCPGLIPS
jgi:hypothetical protein